MRYCCSSFQGHTISIVTMCYAGLEVPPSPEDLGSLSEGKELGVRSQCYYGGKMGRVRGSWTTLECGDCSFDDEPLSEPRRDQWRHRWCLFRFRTRLKGLERGGGVLYFTEWPNLYARQGSGRSLFAKLTWTEYRKRSECLYSWTIWTSGLTLGLARQWRGCHSGHWGCTTPVTIQGTLYSLSHSIRVYSCWEWPKKSKRMPTWIKTHCVLLFF